MDLLIKKLLTLWGTGKKKPKDLSDLMKKISWLIPRRKNCKVGRN